MKTIVITSWNNLVPEKDMETFKKWLKEYKLSIMATKLIADIEVVWSKEKVTITLRPNSDAALEEYVLNRENLDYTLNDMCKNGLLLQVFCMVGESI